MKNYYLTGGRLVSAKNFDLIINAFNKLNLPLKIYGAGVLESELKNVAGSTIEFLGKVSDDELNNLYKNAKAFVVAQKDEDFGMTLVEAQAQGCPIIAYRGGGYLESIIENKTGVFFEDDKLIEAVKKFEKMNFKSEDCIQNAKKFSKERFVKEMVQFVNAHSKEKEI